MEISPDRFRIKPGTELRLSEHGTADTSSLDHDKAKCLFQKRAERLDALQSRLFADKSWSMLLVLQGMDTSGKDSTIKHVATGLNPQGMRVVSFGPPSAEEQAHDFLWRIHNALPRRGMIGIFNRSHYEEVLVPRADPAALRHEMLPTALTGRCSPPRLRG